MDIFCASVLHLILCVLKFIVTNQNKLILKTAGITAYWAFIAVSAFAWIFSILFPFAYADFFDMTGNTSLYADYKLKTYEQSPTQKNLYYALSANIIADGKTNNVIKLGGKFFATGNDEHRKQIVTAADAHLVRAAGRDVNKLALANTDDFLRRGYIRALVSRGGATNVLEAKRAFQTAIPEPLSAIDPIDLLRPSFAILELPNTPEYAEERSSFLLYYGAFVSLYGAHPDLQPTTTTNLEYQKAKYFVTYALVFFNEKFGG
jgi:hypothetical protein